jgi:hypothetical protein
MINYRVDDLDELLQQLQQAGVTIDPHREDYDYGPLCLDRRSRWQPGRTL